MDPINQSQHPRTQGAGVGDWEWEDLGALTECSEITELLQILEKHMLTRRLEVFLGGRRETLVSPDFCRGPEGTSQGASVR